MSEKSNKAALRKSIVKKRIKKFAESNVFGRHVCPNCWRDYKYLPVLSPFDSHAMSIQKGVDYICPKCVKEFGE